VRRSRIGSLLLRRSACCGVGANGFESSASTCRVKEAPEGHRPNHSHSIFRIQQAKGHEALSVRSESAMMVNAGFATGALGTPSYRRSMIVDVEIWPSAFTALSEVYAVVPPVCAVRGSTMVRLRLPPGRLAHQPRRMTIDRRPLAPALKRRDRLGMPACRACLTVPQPIAVGRQAFGALLTPAMNR
jgi:hypothetical protein